MLGAPGTIMSFAYLRHRPRRNPLASLPEAGPLLERVTHCLITHSRALGLRILQHSDHLDPAAEAFLRQTQLPVICPQADAAYLRQLGLNVTLPLHAWQPTPFLDGEITAVPAQHGHGWMRHLMANGIGVFLQLPGEPSIYLSGDTVLTADVQRALTTFAPEIAVVAAGGASMDVGQPILMTLDEVVEFVRLAPGRVIANHLEALNHCPVTRAQLRQALAQENLLTKVHIPNDGETMLFTNF